MIFERKVMRKIFGPTRSDDGYWRFKSNQEINDILKGQNNVQKIKRWKPMPKRPIGRHKTNREDEVFFYKTW
jgi:hypothetical protein